MTSDEARKLVGRYYYAKRLAMNRWRAKPENFKLAPGGVYDAWANSSTAHKIREAIDIVLNNDPTARYGHGGVPYKPVVDESLADDQIVFEWQGVYCP